MRRRLLILPVVALVLAACGAPEETPTPAAEASSTPVLEATQRPTAEPTVEPTTEAPEPADLLAHCSPTETQGPIGEAILTADLPDTTQIASVLEYPPLPDAEDQDSTVVQVTLCSIPLDRDEHVDVAGAITQAALTADGPGIYRIDVALEMPLEDGSMREGRVLYLEDVQTVMDWADPAIRNAWHRV